MRKVLYYYTDEDIDPETHAYIKELFECDILIVCNPMNILDRTQYPYFEAKLIKWEQ